jgi:TPR repeat protein
MTTTDFVQGEGKTEYDALDADHLASFAEEQFALGDAARASALKLADASRHAARSRVAAERVMATAVEPLTAAAAGGHAEARLVLAALLEGGYGSTDSVPKPGRALYHRLMAAASGDPMARLAMGAATVLGNDAFLSGAEKGAGQEGVPSRSPPRLPVARCALALHYFYHSATTAYEDSARPGGQARVERGRLHENTRRVKGDLRGESDDRVLYLSRAADLGDARAMLAMGNGYYWGNFGLPRDHEAALRFYRRAHRAGALQGTVGVAKMVLKGEGAPRNASEALEHYRAAAERGSADALNGLGYLYFYGEDVDLESDESAGSETSEGSSSSLNEEASGKTSSLTKIQKNDTLALEYFRRAAELGNGDGLVNAGTMLRSGLGAPADVAAAHALFARCSLLPGEHPACSYQAALIEASGEGGVPRDCDLAVARLRRVAEGGQWMAPLQEGMKAHLAGKKNEAGWLYEYASASSLPAASFNAAWLGERDARDARVARRFGFGADDEDDEDDTQDNEDDEATVRDDEIADPAREIAAVAFSREKRAATSVRRHASRVRADSAADDAMRSWAALQLADCEYYGASRPGGCAPGSKRKALRLYREAAASARAALALSDPRAEPPRTPRARRAKAAEKETQQAPSREEQEAAARAAEDAGGSLDARRLLTHALYAEAWMRAKGEACSADRERAKRALGEALDVGGWRELVAVAPPFCGLALLDLADAACAFVFAPSGPKRGSCAESLMALASSFVGGDAASGLPDDDASGEEQKLVGSRDAHKSRRFVFRDASSDVSQTRERDSSVARKKKSLSPGAFGLRLVSELVAAASAWEDAVAEHAERWRFTLALSWSLLMATVGFAVGWRLVVRPLVAALYGERARFEWRVDGGLDRVARGDHGGGVIGEMRRRIERMRAEAAAEAENRRRVLSEAPEASEASETYDARRTNDDAARRETDDDDEDDAGDGGEDFLSGFVASAVSSAVQRVTAPPAAERAPFDLGDLDDSSVGGHAVIRGRRDEEDR